MSGSKRKVNKYGNIFYVYLNLRIFFEYANIHDQDSCRFDLIRSFSDMTFFLLLQASILIALMLFYIKQKKIISNWVLIFQFITYIYAIKRSLLYIKFTTLKGISLCVGTIAGGGFHADNAFYNGFEYMPKAIEYYDRFIPIIFISIPIVMIIVLVTNIVVSREAFKQNLPFRELISKLKRGVSEYDKN